MTGRIWSREIIRKLEAAGWQEVRVAGSHHHFRHPSRPGAVTATLTELKIEDGANKS